MNASKEVVDEMRSWRYTMASERGFFGEIEEGKRFGAFESLSPQELFLFLLLSITRRRKNSKVLGKLVFKGHTKDKCFRRQPCYLLLNLQKKKTDRALGTQGAEQQKKIYQHM